MEIIENKGYEKGVAPFSANRTNPDILSKIASLKEKFGKRLLILGHHYQHNDIIRFADISGDSYVLSQKAAASNAELIVFCGVHFMAESADILKKAGQKVFLPHAAAGCAMADMATVEQAETAWNEMTAATKETIIPVTYINSSAAIKALVGRNGGTVCTSSNAGKIFDWALTQGQKILFLPDQHLGRNTAYKKGISLNDMIVWDPAQQKGGNSSKAILQAKIILWKGHCSVHRRFKPEHIDTIRQKYPEIQIAVHPECEFEVVQKSDYSGSTKAIIEVVKAHPEVNIWAVGTEQHLVNRLKEHYPEKMILPLAANGYACTTMALITPEYLLKTLEHIDAGDYSEQVTVNENERQSAFMALQRMMEIS